MRERGDSSADVPSRHRDGATEHRGVRERSGKDVAVGRRSWKRSGFPGDASAVGDRAADARRDDRSRARGRLDAWERARALGRRRCRDARRAATSPPAKRDERRDVLERSSPRRRDGRNGPRGAASSSFGSASACASRHRARTGGRRPPAVTGVEPEAVPATNPATAELVPRRRERQSSAATGASCGTGGLGATVAHQPESSQQRELDPRPVQRSFDHNC